jgi:hypothetical protein
MAHEVTKELVVGHVMHALWLNLDVSMEAALAFAKSAVEDAYKPGMSAQEWESAARKPFAI